MSRSPSHKHKLVTEKPLLVPSLCILTWWQVAEIKEIKEKAAGGDIRLQVAWYYRPEEAAGGRKMFHGSRELFRSNHHDEIEAGTITRKCQILTLDAYQALPRPIKDDVYFSRVFYSAQTQKFKPPRWTTYCTCKMPYNPDLDMVQCSFCREYFHIHCLQSAGHLPPGPPPDVWDCQTCKGGWKESGGAAQ